MLRLYVRDNTNDQVHEYGTICHDALILQPDGSLHYENMQSCTGTECPEEGYSFCQKDGTIPDWDLEYGMEPYIDIAGEYYRDMKLSQSDEPTTSITQGAAGKDRRGRRSLQGKTTAAASGRPTARRKSFRRLAVALAGLIGLELAVIVLAYRYPLQNGMLRLCAAASMAGSCFVCGMIFERAK